MRSWHAAEYPFVASFSETLCVGLTLNRADVLALYGALREVSESFMAVGVALFFVAIAAYFASNTAFEMLSLSDQ